ncbi:hypothetical protein NX059_011710 [Plenodomus lindquistii]|nr:hypothetical protein NX059_011710 [Plenodomus lindquistii]
MASTYALPTTATTANAHTHTHSHSHSHSHSHGRSQSQYTPEPSPYASSPMTGASPAKENGHRHYRSDMNGSGQLHGAVRSPYAEYNNSAHDHNHSHERKASNDSTSTYTLKPFLNGGSASRLRGDSDLGRSSPRKGATKYGFSPIHESAPVPPPAPASSSWLELPEALTALLIPLPYLLASVAFPHAATRLSKLPSTLSEAVAESAPIVEPLHTTGGAPLLHALILSSATLLLIGVVAKVTSSLQPLDRRKADKGSMNNAPAKVLSTVFGVLLPFYASLQLGGSKTALGLLIAVGAGLASPAQSKQAPWAAILQTLKTRKATCGALFLGIAVDVLSSEHASGTTLGHAALLSSIFLIPLPLSASGKPGSANHSEDSYINQRSSHKPVSPLINSAESTLLTIVSGLVLAVVSILYYLATSSLSSVSLHTVGVSVLSIASATALVFFSLPLALQSQRHTGLKLGALLVGAFSLYEHYHSSLACLAFLWACATLVGTTIFDTRPQSVSGHSHSHSHSGRQHAHNHDLGHKHDHHLHGNHSRLSAFLIASATPGSIIHSVLIEKDSRRIAYFGVLNLGFMLVQFFYGFVSGSLGLLTDSIHMLFDCAGLAVGLAAAVMSKWRPNARFPYGYGKIDTLSGFANGVFLLYVLQASSIDPLTDLK